MKFLGIIWYPKFHDPVHNSPAVVPTLSQANPSHNIKAYFIKNPFKYYPSIYVDVFQVTYLYSSSFHTKIHQFIISPIRSTGCTHFIFINLDTL
jgi:hypothetical protein